MANEAQAFRTTIKDFVNVADKVEQLVPFEGVGSLIPEVSKTAMADHAAAFVDGSVNDMRTTFQNLINSPVAHEFAGFFEHVREQCAKGEPLYALLLGHEIPTTKNEIA